MSHGDVISPETGCWSPLIRSGEPRHTLPLIPLICFVETRQAIRVADHPKEQMLLDRYGSPG